MEAYRDQYATLFNNGRNVVVIGISVDPDSAYDIKNKVDNRSLFVVGPDGRVAYVTRPFKVLTPSAYTELAAVVDSLSPPPQADSAK
jgi:peroxiredoxin